MEQYVKNLINQFTVANGIQNPDINSEQFVEEFSHWLKARKTIGKEYTYFIDYMGFSFANPECAEIGKGQYDSIVLPFDTTIITPASKTFKELDSKRIITGNMRVYESTPLLVRHSKKGRNFIDQIPSDIIRTYMTQNPFTPSSIMGWEELHNSGVADIIVGIYGSTQDKDMDKKIKQMQSFKDKIQTRCIDEMAVAGDSYFYAVGSERLVKKLTKTRTR